jgi:predicted acylesterase/phospholipase RssA
MSKKIIASRQRDLAAATGYGEWREVALELDRLEGTDAWKQDETSDDYDYLLIRERLTLMRELRRKGNVRELTFHLAEGLHGNLANTSNPLLYGYARVGTKRLIEEYVEEAARCLDYVCVGDFKDFSDDEKVLFFKRTGASFGRSALLLSGGATLGMFHLGVIKALFEANLLPRVVSGSSAGSIIAAMACTRTDAELPAMLDPKALNLAAFQRVSFAKLIKGAPLMDSTTLAACLNANVGEESFVAAFERTRRILGVTVSPAEQHQQPRLLNYLTAPNVLVRKAVQASCAIPGVFEPVMLEARGFNGEVVPYMRSKLWVDGTLANDLPLLRLARLHNVNHYIVSQTNPHVVPFLQDNVRRSRGVATLAGDLVKTAGRDVVKVAREHFQHYTAAGRVVDKLNGVLQQRYSGDVTLFPSQTPRQLMRMLSNPSAADIAAYIQEGERATWPKLERIRMQTRISRAFEDCTAWLKTRAEERQLSRLKPRLRAAARARGGMREEVAV